MNAVANHHFLSQFISHNVPPSTSPNRPESPPQVLIRTRERLRLRNLPSPLPLRLPTLPIPLLQPRHPRLAHLRIPSIERLQLLRRHDRRELHFLRGRRLGLGLGVSGLRGLRVRRVGVSVCGADEDRGGGIGGIGGVGGEERFLGQEDRAAGFLGCGG